MATDADVPALADALADAFVDDPVMMWLFGTDEARTRRRLQRFFRVESRRHLRHPHVFTTSDTAGAACWDPPDCWRSRPRDYLPLVPLMTVALGLRARQAMRGLGRIEAVHERFPSHFYLSLLGTRSARQGEGIGSALLQPVLEHCDTHAIGAYLESSKQANVPFYERHGFGVVEEITLPDGPTLWAMWRDPRSPEHDT